MTNGSSPYVWLLLTLTLVEQAMAQQPSTDPERTKHLERMREVAGSIRVLANAERADSAVKLRTEPLLRYSDSTRDTRESALWIWTQGGRPTAVLAVEYFTKSPTGPAWLYEIASLSTTRIAAECDGNFRWSAKEPGLKLQALPDAPPPADKEARRLAQMKELRNRFSATENASFMGRLELRPLVTPLLRYSDPQKNLLDGAIFSFANGTNPEVFLLLESHDVGGKPEWQYALVQMTGEPITVQLDGKEIWHRDVTAPPAVRESYINGWIASTAIKE